MSIEFHPPECCTFITCEFINIYEFTESSLTNYFIWQLHTGSAWFREILIKSRVNFPGDRQRLSMAKKKITTRSYRSQRVRDRYLQPPPPPPRRERVLLSDGPPDVLNPCTYNYGNTSLRASKNEPMLGGIQGWKETRLGAGQAGLQSGVSGWFLCGCYQVCCPCRTQFLSFKFGIILLKAETQQGCCHNCRRCPWNPRSTSCHRARGFSKSWLYYHCCKSSFE